MAEKMGYKQLGICDVGNLHGAYHFAIEAQRETYSPLLELSLFLSWKVYLYPLVLLLKILRVIKIF